MQRERIRFPDERAVSGVLERSRGTAAEIILRLAWDLGLSREEICRLQWRDVSFEGRELVLPDRRIPMDESVCRCLSDRRREYGGASDYVVLSDRLRRPMRPESVSRIARAALDTEPLLAGIRLIDLRYGFILRQVNRHGWPYAARVSGVRASAMQAVFLPALKSAGQAAADAPPVPSAPGGQRVAEIIRSEGLSAAGLALWMIWELGIEARESIALTWDQVDFDAEVLLLPDRSVPMDRELKRRLSALRRSRSPDADPHVLLTPKTMQPYDSFGISRAIRAALVRGGADGTLQDLRSRQEREREEALVLRCAGERGGISRREAAELLRSEENTAGRCLRRLVGENRLVRIGAKYYLQGAVVSPEDQYAVISEYLKKSGTAFRKDLAELLRIEGRPCGWILHRLVEQGKLIKTGQHYSLPPEQDAE